LSANRPERLAQEVLPVMRRDDHADHDHAATLASSNR
jgi:hypothetical protein